jgi:hypothetical protein
LATVLSETLPDARIIVCLREPIERCWSWYRFVQDRTRIPKDLAFSAYLDICHELHRSGQDGLRKNQPFTGLCGSAYDERLEEWLDVFGDRLRIEYFDALATDARGTVEGILRWLGVDDEVARGFRYDVENRTVPYRSRRLQRGAVVLNRWSERFVHGHGGLKRLLRSGYYAVNGNRPPAVLEPAERERLASFYAPHNRRTAEVLRSAGYDRLPRWLADEP